MKLTNTISIDPASSKYGWNEYDRPFRATGTPSQLLALIRPLKQIPVDQGLNVSYESGEHDSGAIIHNKTQIAIDSEFIHSLDRTIEQLERIA